jgi:Holliday junction resolvase RusA-like endonuclease
MTTWTMRLVGPVVGKQRVQINRRTGAFYTHEKTSTYEARLRHAMRSSWVGAPLVGPVALGAAVYVRPPESWSKKKREAAMALWWVVAKPDVDNVLKSIADAAKGIIWNDDTQMTKVVMIRGYEEVASIEIAVAALQAPSSGNRPRLLDMIA